SGSATAAAAAIGGTLNPIQKADGYEPRFSAAVNISSCVTGLLIPPSNALIVYSLSAGGISIAALFLAGYLPGMLMGLAIMGVVAVVAYRNKEKYPVSPRPTLREAVFAFLDALPSLFLIILVIGGIAVGAFTATEASAIAVVYTFVLSVVIYRSITLSQLPGLILQSVVMTSVVLFLVGMSVGMSWAMTNADIPFVVSETLLKVSDSPAIIMLIITFILFIVGMFMDLTPAVLIFTPIFLPIAKQLGIDPIHFGIILVFNLCIGLCTPPVGTALFVGCSVADVKIQDVLKPLLWLYAAQIVSLLLVIFVPEISLAVPHFFGMR
ncbi:MAG: TRAP transporter large permease, partial [Methylobacteriaceae bacterium]|nr:TRAP transporter large permease [Methylobacteriaceae bacterium]